MGTYGILPAGHFLTIYGMALFFLPVVSGFGLVISNHSTTLQQAMFVMWFFMLILILMSGLFTPITVCLSGRNGLRASIRYAIL